MAEAHPETRTTPARSWGFFFGLADLTRATA